MTTALVVGDYPAPFPGKKLFCQFTLLAMLNRVIAVLPEKNFATRPTLLPMKKSLFSTSKMFNFLQPSSIVLSTAGFSPMLHCEKFTKHSSACFFIANDKDITASTHSILFTERSRIDIEELFSMKRARKAISLGPKQQDRCPNL